MDLNEYQQRAESTAIYNSDGDEPTDFCINYCILGLIGESGELANKWKKYYRDGLALADVTVDLGKELGDVLWYVANLAAELGMDLDDLAKLNLEKLQRRATSGSLNGNGDDR
jgi:NTP pyrophosphatase (non-canonical NTP hydrolase)